MRLSIHEDARTIKRLRQERDEALEELQQLKDKLDGDGDDLTIPGVAERGGSVWNLTEMESHILFHLSQHERLSGRTLCKLLYGSYDEKKEGSVRVLIYRIRKVMRRYSVEIPKYQRGGYSIKEPGRTGVAVTFKGLGE